MEREFGRFCPKIPTFESVLCRNSLSLTYQQKFGFTGCFFDCYLNCFVEMY